MRIHRFAQKQEARKRRQIFSCFLPLILLLLDKHSGYFEYYPETVPDELYEALMEIRKQKLCRKLQKTLTAKAEDDGYQRLINLQLCIARRIDNV